MSVLYRHNNGFLFFELDDDNKPLPVWRDCKTGKYPMKTRYTLLQNILNKIIMSKTSIVYTNDATPLIKMYNDNINCNLHITIRPFFVPVDELIERFVKELTDDGPSEVNNLTDEIGKGGKKLAIQCDNHHHKPTYKTVKKLDPAITYKDFLEIYK